MPKGVKERREPRSSDPSDLRLPGISPSVSLMEMLCHVVQRMACISQLHLKAWAVHRRYRRKIRVHRRTPNQTEAMECLGIRRHWIYRHSLVIFFMLHNVFYRADRRK